MEHGTDLGTERPADNAGVAVGSDAPRKRGAFSVRSRAWCVTLNNWTQEELRALDSLNAARIVFGDEVAPKTGTPHLQGYVRFKEPCRLSWWKRHFPRAHVEVRRESEATAAGYCYKDRKVLIDRGVDEDDLERVSCKRPRDETALQVLDDIEDGLSYAHLRKKYRVFCFWNRRNVLMALSDHRHYKNDPDAPDPQQ